MKNISEERSEYIYQRIRSIYEECIPTKFKEKYIDKLIPYNLDTMIIVITSEETKALIEKEDNLELSLAYFAYINNVKHTLKEIFKNAEKIN